MSQFSLPLRDDFVSDPSQTLPGRLTYLIKNGLIGQIRQNSNTYGFSVDDPVANYHGKESFGGFVPVCPSKPNRELPVFDLD